MNYNHSYIPDGYRFILIDTPDTPLIKLFASWSGGYLDADAWRMNSGCSSIVETEDNYLVYGFSGSCYTLRKHQGNLNAYSSSVYAKILVQSGVQEISVQEAIKILEELK